MQAATLTVIRNGSGIAAVVLQGLPDLQFDYNFSFVYLECVRRTWAGLGKGYRRSVRDVVEKQQSRPEEVGSLSDVSNGSKFTAQLLTMVTGGVRAAVVNCRKGTSSGRARGRRCGAEG